MKRIAMTLACTAMMLSVDDESDPNLDALTVVSTISSVDGAVGGYVWNDDSRTSSPDPTSCGAVGPKAIIYPISGDVFAATVNPMNGETVGAVAKVGTIDASPEFSVDFFKLLSEPWQSLGVMDWTMGAFSMVVGGSTFEYIDGMELDGGATEITLTTGTLTSVENLIDDGLLDYAAMLDGDVGIGIEFENNGRVTMTIIQE